MLRINEAAAALGVTRRTIYRYINRGLLPAVYVTDDRQVVPTAAVEALRPRRGRARARDA